MEVELGGFAQSECLLDGEGVETNDREKAFLAVGK